MCKKREKLQLVRHTAIQTTWRIQGEKKKSDKERKKERKEGRKKEIKSEREIYREGMRVRSISISIVERHRRGDNGK